MGFIFFLFCQEFDFHVRWPGVKLLTALLKNQGVQVQGIILVSPMGELALDVSSAALSQSITTTSLTICLYVCLCAGVSRLMDLLADSREVIRNDVSLPCGSIR